MSAAAFTFIDLFAGIGGIRLALEAAGGRCVMTSEWDVHAQKTYRAYFGADEEIHGDIRAVDAAGVPDHDVLAAGFPCQPFSLAGVSKKNSLGRSHGFDDPTQGTLFFDILRLIDEKRPRALLLENVKHLKRHDKGRTFAVIADALTERGYGFSSRILDSAQVVPQHRERIFIAAFRSDDDRVSRAGEHDLPEFWQLVDAHLTKAVNAQRERYRVAAEQDWPRLGPVLESNVPSKYGLSPKLYQYLLDYRQKHAEKGNGFGCSIVNPETKYTRTISARYYKDGSEALLERPHESTPRRLTPFECARLQGFPEDFAELFSRQQPAPVSDVHAYKQFGNSVTVPVVTAVAMSLAAVLRRDLQLGESTADAVRQPELALVG